VKFWPVATRIICQKHHDRVALMVSTANLTFAVASTNHKQIGASGQDMIATARQIRKRVRQFDGAAHGATLKHVNRPPQ